MSIETNKELLSEDGLKNKYKIFCTKCSSVVLKENDGYLFEKEIELPSMKTKNELTKEISKTENQFEFQKQNYHWCVDDIYTFENLGFSNTVSGLKYLICADCEYGPIGIQCLENKKSYLAINRVEYNKK